MKPLQPILDMLERADSPRARVREAMKPKPAKATIGTSLAFDELMRQQMMQLGIQQQLAMQQTARTQNLSSQNISNQFGQGLAALLGGGR